jgi:4-amino-4-deoxy-L-arabinose transferase-like glycosyltransferase
MAAIVGMRILFYPPFFYVIEAAFYAVFGVRAVSDHVEAYPELAR